MKKVYICAPLAGDMEGNLEMAKRYSEYALRCGAAPVTPHVYTFRKTSVRSHFLSESIALLLG